MRASFIGVFGALLVLVISPGCGDSRPEELRVQAKNFGDFYYWRSSVSSRFTPESWREFNDAVQELRLKAMARGVTGTDAIDQAMCDEIRGRTVEEVLRLADAAKLARLQQTRRSLAAIYGANSLLGTRAGDDASATDLAARLRDQDARLKQTLAEIDATEKHLIAHGGTVPRSPADDATPSPLAREAALAEFARMIEGRRQYAMRRYGEWLATVDRSGGELTGADRTYFLQRMEAAKINGHAVIPVFIRAGWRIYDDVVTLPQFGEMVMANLTEADRRELVRTWGDSEAEIWARRQASMDTPDAIRARVAAAMQPAAGVGEDAAPRKPEPPKPKLDPRSAPPPLPMAPRF